MKLIRNDFYSHLYGRHRHVTGSCFLVSGHLPDNRNIRFLLDCGSFQGNDNLGYLDLNEVIPFDTQKIDFVLITHNHIDHIGLLPLLVNQGYRGPIYVSKPGYGLIDIPINESWKTNCKHKTYPSYTREDVEQLFSQIRGVSFNQKICPKKNVEVTFFQNGHIVGASAIEVKFTYDNRDDIKILFTGDYNNKNLFFDVKEIPAENLRTPYSLVYCESTYGGVGTSDERFMPLLCSKVKPAIGQGMKVIIPTFAMGRTQEICYYIKSMQDNGLLSENIPVWQGGTSAREITNRFRFNNLGLNPSMKNFLPQNFHFIPSKQRNEICRKLLDSPNPSIIISPSGMASYGAIKTFITKAISQDDVLIAFPGHCTTDSKGCELINTPKGANIEYGGYLQTRYCDIIMSGELSAHAKRNDLLNFLNPTNPKSILVNHGEQPVREKFICYLKENLPSTTRIENFNPDYGYSINADGIYEIFPSKFQLF